MGPEGIILVNPPITTLQQSLTHSALVLAQNPRMLLFSFICPVSVELFTKMDLTESDVVTVTADLVINNEQKTNYKCDLCPKEYAILMRLHRHKSDHKNGKVPLKMLVKSVQKQVWKKGKYQCEVCQKVMPFHYELKRHQRHEHEEANLNCMYCERKFYEK